MKEFEWFEWFEWFGPSPIEPFNSGLHGVHRAEQRRAAPLVLEVQAEAARHEALHGSKVARAGRAREALAGRNESKGALGSWARPELETCGR